MSLTAESSCITSWWIKKIFALLRALCTATTRKLARMPMITTTVSISTSVKPRRKDEG
jgi:hypothetical protein